jgi:hypothetical protein
MVRIYCGGIHKLLLSRDKRGTSQGIGYFESHKWLASYMLLHVQA